ncbi:MAG: PfkB family carbohydrate kinase [Acidobacteriota bacterium]|nr:PfkB family carbohydrate kinase [Acidobacteriota bacterium]
MPQRLRRIVEAFSNVSVLVVADLVADEFLAGEIARVSREAPVLILRHRERTLVPGGGANAVMNLAALGVTALPVGLVGDDEAGRTLLQIFRKHKIPVSGITKLKGHITTTKTRVLAYSAHSSRQQVVRIDRECDPLSDNHPALRELVASAREYVPAADAVLLSDYGYGSVTPHLFEQIRAKSALGEIPVTLDSRYRMTEYQGVTAATPNEGEVEEALNVRIGHDHEQLLNAGAELLRRMKLESLVITRGGDGMVAFERKKKPLEIPIHGSNQVVDVTGAGDTVIATFTAALAAGADTASAALLANYAGGLVVMKRGTATISQAELLEALAD